MISFFYYLNLFSYAVSWLSLQFHSLALPTIAVLLQLTRYRQLSHFFKWRERLPFSIIETRFVLHIEKYIQDNCYFCSPNSTASLSIYSFLIIQPLLLPSGSIGFRMVQLSLEFCCSGACQSASSKTTHLLWPILCCSRSIYTVPDLPVFAATANYTDCNWWYSRHTWSYSQPADKSKKSYYVWISVCPCIV